MASAPRYLRGDTAQYLFQPYPIQYDFTVTLKASIYHSSHSALPQVNLSIT